MAHKPSVELNSVINEVLHKVLNKKNKHKCKEFNANLMAGYIENRLTDKERRKYEKHLFNCDYCFNLYKNIENEIELLYKEKYFPVMDDLINKAMEKLGLDNQNNKISGIIVKLLNNGLEIIEINKFNNFILEPVPMMRGNKNNNILKSFKVLKKHKNIKYEITVEYLTNEEINLIISIQKDKTQNMDLKLTSETGDEILKKLNNYVKIENLSKNRYKLFINNDFFFNLDMK